MASNTNVHISRLESIGLGKEATAGTKDTVDYWFPKKDGTINPVVEKAVDNSWYGVIESRYNSAVSKEMSELSLWGIIKDESIGLLLLCALGKETLCIKLGTWSKTGTYVVGETVTWGTSWATGTVKKVRATYIVVEVAAWTFQDAETLTGWTSGATSTSDYDSSIYVHLFEVQQDNNHPTMTTFGNNSVQDVYATYCAINSFGITVNTEEYITFNTSILGKALSDDGSPPTPSFTVENLFMARHTNVYLASTAAWLDSADAEDLQNLSVNIEKNLYQEPKLWTKSVNAFHNQNLDVSGSISGIYKTNDTMDLLRNETKRFMRIDVVNSDVTIGTAENPAMIMEFGQMVFDDFNKSSDNDQVATVDSNFVGEFNQSSGYSMSIELINTKSSTY